MINSMDDGNTAVAWALKYAAAGIPVLPVWGVQADGTCRCGIDACASAGKHPNGRLAPRGIKDGSTDTKTILRCWHEDPSASVGVVTGLVSGIVILDVDPRNGGRESIRLLRARGCVIPADACVRTGGGGYHLYYRRPGGEFPSRAGLLPGIDIKADGGFVVAPPSEHASGRAYDWKNAPDFAALPDSPDWLNELARSPKDHFNSRRTGEHSKAGERIPKGRRNNSLASLAGTMRRRSMSSDEILAALLAVNTSRCDPPLADHEVETIARSIGTKPAGGAGSSRLHSTRSAWPELEEEALYGVAGDLVRAIEPHTEADPVAVLLQILVGFGNKIGRKSFFQVESARHYPNEYVVLVGETSKGRKGTSWSIVSSVLKDVDPAWAIGCVQSGLSSGEGLIWAVRDAITQHTPVKEKGRVVDYEDVVIDPGVTDKRLLVVEAEFANTLKMMQREGNVLSPTIRAAWDSGDLRTLTKNSHAVATGAHVSIIGHITIDELLRYLSSTEAGNGYANRHLFILVRRSKLLPDGGNLSIKDLAPLIQRLKSAAAFAEQDQEFTRDIEARELWRTVYEQLSTGKPGLYGAVTSRSEAHAVRYSAIYAALDCSTTIRREHLLAALAIVRYGDESVRHIFGDSLGDSVADDILQALRAAQPDGLTRTELSDVFKGHQRKGNIDRALQLLLGHGLVRVEKQHTDGRPAEVWYATKSEDVRDGARG